MRTFKSNLTRMKTKINERFPDGEDVFGYPGINKGMIIDTIDTIYALSNHIENQNDHPFEVISLKRLCVRVYDSFNEIMDKDNIEYAINPFFTNLSELLDKTKHTYFVFTGSGFKSEKQYGDLNNKIEELITLHSHYDNWITQIKDIKENIVSIDNEITKIHEDISSKNNDIQHYSSDIENKKENFDEIYEKVEGWDEEILESKGTIKNIKEEIVQLENRYKKVALNIDESETRTQKILNIIEEQQKKNDFFQEQIEKTLGNANRFGMAGSFKERKDEISKIQNVWMTVFISSLLLVSGISFYTFIWEPMRNITNIFSFEFLGQFLTRLAVISPVLWISWFSAKQYNQVNKIREDYSYKYASSMAYEGYKKAAMECDEKLATQLLDSSINSLSLHPIRLFPNKKNDHISPVTEIIESISNMPFIEKLSFDIPSLNGRMEVKLKDKSQSIE